MSSFLDVRDHGFVRTAVGLPRVQLGRPGDNAAEHLQILSDSWEAGVQYVVFPELGLTGYSLSDLFHSRTLLEGATSALRTVIEETSGWALMATVGLPLEVDGAVFNCAATFARGRLLAVTPKTYPPEYREFYELRHFARAPEARRDTVDLLDQRVPFSRRLLVAVEEHRHLVLHVEICEDLWVPIPPSAEAALAGATLLANLSASNVNIGKSEYRERLVVGSSARNLAVHLYADAGFGESSTDVAWDGDGYVAERGRVLVRSDRFGLESQLLVADVDLEAVVQDRMRQSSFHQNAADHPAKFERVVLAGRLGREGGEEVYRSFRRTIPSHPFVPTDPARRDERCREIFSIQSTALARRLLALPERRRRVVLGVSGGQDSAHALLVAAHALDLLKLPRSRIVALTMPGFGTTDRTYRNACDLIRAVGATFREIPIPELASGVFRKIGHDPEDHDVTFENVQAWTRKQLELAVASEEGGLVVGTSDLSELLLGWSTMFGDHASHYGVNCDVPKTLISFLIAWTAEAVFADEPEVQRTLHDVLSTPISPELLPPDAEGTIRQRTEEEIGPYELHDFFGFYFVRFGYAPSKIARLALAAYEGSYSLAEIKRWLEVFLRRFFASQYKRSCLPDGPKVGMTAVSPRGDWRMPSDAEPATWLADLERVPDSPEE